MPFFFLKFAQKSNGGNVEKLNWKHNSRPTQNIFAEKKKQLQTKNDKKNAY